MDYTYSDKDIILEIEQYMNDKFEVYKTKKQKKISKWNLLRF